MTQNSLPSGSASTTCPSSGRWPTSMWRAPSSTNLATVSSWSSMEVVVRSRWRRFGPAFRSEHDMPLVWALADVDVAGAELDQSRDRLILVIDGGGREIEMETVWARLPI